MNKTLAYVTVCSVIQEHTMFWRVTRHSMDAGGASSGELEVSWVPTTQAACASPFFLEGAREE